MCILCESVAVWVQKNWNIVIVSYFLGVIKLLPHATNINFLFLSLRSQVITGVEREQVYLGLQFFELKQQFGRDNVLALAPLQKHSWWWCWIWFLKHHDVQIMWICSSLSPPEFRNLMTQNCWIMNLRNTSVSSHWLCLLLQVEFLWRCPTARNWELWT